jgi:hypothetical protein
LQDPCCYRLRLQNITECSNNLQIVLNGGQFLSYSANGGAGWSLQVLGANYLKLTYNGGFIPIGASFPMIFCLKPGSNNPELSVTWEFTCGPGEGCAAILPLPACPDPNDGSIFGTKYRTCVAEPYNGSQEVIAGWPVYLYNAATNELIDSTLTDAQGYYAFNFLPLGVYWCREALQGWTPVIPASGEYLVDLDPSEQYMANFGNCPPSNCASNFSFAVTCNSVQFTNTSSGVGGYTSSWNFGDNSPVSTQTSPNHIYSSPGTYNVCLTITAGNQCTKTFCKTVTISNLGNPPTVVCPPSFTVNLPANA